MDAHDLAQRVPSQRLRLTLTFQVTSDPVPGWLRPSQAAAAAALLVGFAALLFVPDPRWLPSLLITLGALATLVLRLLSLRWAPALTAGPWPRVAGTGELTVTVTGPGPTPLRAVKAVRDLTGASLRAAHDAVMAPPTTLLSGADQTDAARVADALRAAGAEVTVEPHPAPVGSADA
jgi:hypothetical protein